MAIPNPSAPEVETLARDVGTRINHELTKIFQSLLSDNVRLNGASLQLDCTLSTGLAGPDGRPQSFKLASVDIPTAIGSSHRPPFAAADDNRTRLGNSGSRRLPPLAPSSRINHYEPLETDDEVRSTKRRAAAGLQTPTQDFTGENLGVDFQALATRLENNGDTSAHRKQRSIANPVMQPSTLEKFIAGIWESIFSGMKIDPVEVIEQWQAIESSGQPKLLLDTESEIVGQNEEPGAFGRINVLARKISQTSRTCRSLEVLVQAHWVQCFDDRVAQLSVTMPKEKAKKMAMSEACVDFQWSEKELRNKTGIWRGYHDIKNSGGWAALVFAGMGLYRFCKYRASFNEEMFQTLQALRHRFEVAADTLHPRWRSLLAIVGAPTERKYTGHPHDWVICGPDNNAIPLPETYSQWDKNFAYTHIDSSAIDEEAWGLYDPRTVGPTTASGAYTCEVCGSQQSEDPRQNGCNCFPNIYGGAESRAIPVQVFRTPNGKNNGLLACCAFEQGTAIGEFVGQITSGLSNLDVMVGQTDQAAYQIWQGKQGNHIRFVNHSCQPNSQFEKFIWLGTQRILLVSMGIEAGEEISVDYSHTYWEVSADIFPESYN